LKKSQVKFTIATRQADLAVVSALQSIMMSSAARCQKQAVKALQRTRLPAQSGQGFVTVKAQPGVRPKFPPASAADMTRWQAAKQAWRSKATAAMAPKFSPKFLLPMESAIKGVEGQGWEHATYVATSQISGAGNGRYAGESIKQGSELIVKVLRPMTTIDTLLSLPSDTTITFSSVNDLERYIKLAETEGGYSRNEILTLFEHFIYGFDSKVCCLNVCTWTVNHADSYENGLNCLVVQKHLSDGSTAYVGEAMGDIKEGDEFFMDYRKFTQPEFYVEFTKKHGFKDVRKATLEAVYGSDDVADIYAKNEPLNAY